MEPKSLVLIVAIVLLVEATAAAHDGQVIEALDGCQSYCGNFPIPYPFGVGKSSTTGNDCFLQKSFKLTCNKSDDTLLLGNIPVIAINITQGKVEMKFFISKVCYNSTWGSNRTFGNTPTLRTAPGFTISSEDNKFISVGCDTYGYLNSFYNGRGYSTGCLTRCYGNSMKIDDGNCSGIGCCQVDIPSGMRNITIQTHSYENFNDSLEFNNCSYSFVAKNGNYSFSKKHLENLPYKTIPVVFDWTVGNETCEESKDRGSNACKGNSTCLNSDAGLQGYHSYRCQCNDGYEGNPYHPYGCTDIDECKTGNHTCMSDRNCRNKLGSYECFCPKGQSGDGTKENGCRLQRNGFRNFIIGGITGVILLFVAILLLFWMYQKRKLIKQKERLFEKNGGLILLQQLQQISKREESAHTANIFTSEELKKATNNYDEKLIVGRGGYGTVFKGFLADNRIVAIKKSKIVDQSQNEQFINEVVVLSQINHRNVVKLIGCCLEEEVPILVYEFENNGTLYELIHNEGKANILNWKARLRIATETAGALAYLHSAASIPIVHRDVKSANILLDDTYTAKVSDFGASRLVPLDQIALATMVQGTIGYLDPEYMQTSQLTEKSDVYSFGVVLIELVSGEKPFSFKRSEEAKSLATYFLSCLKEDRLSEVVQVGLWNEESEQEIKEVAILAAKCLRLKGEERPSMKEVEIELEGIRLMQKHPLINEGKNLEETPDLFQNSSVKMCESGESSSQQNIGDDSIKDQVLMAFEDGR